jgi:hypothetical protein
MTNDLKSKREQFTGSSKSKLPVIIGAVAIILTGLVVFIMQGIGKESQQNAGLFGEPVAPTRSYIGKHVSMTPITPIIENGLIKIPLADVDQYNIVSFELENNENFLVPLMVYITPSGRLFAGSSMCEPCKGRSYTLAGETLVCNACRTTYEIETHKFISGSKVCGSYPPVNLNPRVEKGFVIIELEDVLKWRIRA